MSRRTQVLALSVLMAATAISWSAPELTAQANWTQVIPASSPSARQEYGMSYDFVTASALIFGGTSSAGSSLSDTWSWNGASWFQLPTISDPGVRSGVEMVHDSARLVHVMFGGFGAGPFPMSDTWEFNSSTLQWTQVVTANIPQGRGRTGMAYDAANAVTVMFSGQRAISIPFNDTWEYDGVDWTNTSTSGPQARTDHEMVYDSARGKTVLFGGFNFSLLPFNDTWEYDAATNQWSQITTANSPPARARFAMSYDAGRQVTVLHGGTGFNGVLMNDTWEYDGVDWTQVMPATSPIQRQWMDLVFDPARGVNVLFGGQAPAPLNTVGETWEYAASGPAYPGNGTDASIAVSINSIPDLAATNVHSILASDLLTLQFTSPGGTLIGQPFLSFAQLFTTGSPPPQQATLPVFFAPASPSIVLLDGLTNPLSILNPVLGATQITGTIPPTLAGLSTSFLVNLLTVDFGLPPFNLGIAEAHEFQIQ